MAKLLLALMKSFIVKSLNKSILKLTIPNIVSNISVPLVGAVDTILMGHLSALHLAALGSVGTIFMFIYGSLNFLRAGTTGITAQDFGAKRDVGTTMYRATLLAIILGVLLIVFKEPIKDFSFYLMNIDKSYLEYAKEYFDMRIYGAIGVFLNYAIMGWFFGVQNSIYPLIMTICLNISNIALSFYLVVVLKMGILGAAIGTVVAQYVSVIIGIILILKYKQYFNRFNIEVLLQSRELKRFFVVNRDFFIRTLMLTFAFAFFYAQAAKGGVTTLGIMIILVQFIMWFAYIIDGFANAAESIVGRYYGAKDWQKFYLSIKIVFAWGFGVAMLFMAIFYLAGEYITRVYTTDENIIKGVLSFMPLIVLSPIISFGAYVWDGVFIAMTASSYMRNAVTISTLTFVIIFYMFKSIDFSVVLWSSFLLFFFLRGAIQTWQFKKIGAKIERDNIGD